MAKWTHRILSPGVQPAYASNWLHELNAIATHLKFESLDHLLLSTKALPDMTATSKPFQLYTYYSLKAYKRMGFTRDIPLVWEEIASQPIFDNPHILDPTTQKPWVKTESPFADIPHRRIKYVWQLLRFNRKEYKLDPVVRRIT